MEQLPSAARYTSMPKVYSKNSLILSYNAGTAQPVNFVTPVKFVTCRKNAQG